MTLRSGLYAGVVSHVRKRPRAHRLRYRIFMLLVDLDELAALDADLRLFSVDRFNLTGLYPRRHGDGSAAPLKAQVEAHLAAAGLATGGRIDMLCMPAILGSAFNPLTVYFCHAADGSLSAALYEVNNTFGERHRYLVPAGEGPRHADKAFYVSPFMDMDLRYGFRIVEPGEQAVVAVEVSDADGLLLATAFAGARQPLEDRTLLAAWLGHPWMTLGVLAAIHWEALKIWLKGEKVRTRPTPPQQPVTLAVN
jgi:DUF1365 family protein